MTRGSRLLKALWLPLLVAAASVSPPASAQAPSFGTQTIGNQTFSVNVSITPLTLPQASGGSGAISYTLQPVLPDGLSFDADARVLSGTPTTATAATAYTYTALDASDATTNPALSFTLAVVPWIAGNLNQPQTGTVFATPSRYSPFRTGSNPNGYLLNHLVFPSPPPTTSRIYAAAGNRPAIFSSSPPRLTAPGTTPTDGNYTFTSSSRRILSPNTTYFVSFFNSSQQASVTDSLNHTSFDGWEITREVQAYNSSAGQWVDDTGQVLRFRIAATPLPPALSFGAQTIADQTYTANAPITPLTLPPATGGMGVESYTLSPVVSDVIGGLSFNPQTRELWGTPTMGMAPRAFTYTATDDLQRSTSLSFTIAVVAPDMKLRLRVFLEGPLR